MGRLTIDIPDAAHQQLKAKAAQEGVTLRQFMIERFFPEWNVDTASAPSLAEMAADWQERRKQYRLDQPEENWSEITHEGHKW